MTSRALKRTPDVHAGASLAVSQPGHVGIMTRPMTSTRQSA
jgi:hypothetical protein